MPKCPIENCGRQFQNQQTMLQHAKRRHPLQFDKLRQNVTQQIFNKQKQINDEMKMLPKMNKIIQMSKQKKPVQFQRRSVSKKKKQMDSIINNNQSKMSQIISESRQLVDDSQNTGSKKILKRPSLSKKSSAEQDQKLPSLTQVKGKRLKLEALKSEMSKTASNFPQYAKQSNLLKSEKVDNVDSQTIMRSTAPNFNRQQMKKFQSIRSRSKGKGNSQQNSNRSIKEISSTQTFDITQKKLNINPKKNIPISQNTQTQNDPSSKASYRPTVKKIIQRTNLGNKKQKMLTEQPLSESVYVEPKTEVKKQEKIRSLNFKNKGFIKRQNNSISNQNLDQKLEVNWKERLISIKNNPFQIFRIPQQAQVQYLYLKSCQVKQLDLNQCFSLIQLDASNNQLRNFDFLSETQEGNYQNLENLYLDHNKIESISSLPTYLNLKKLSLTFNKISNLDELIKILIKIPTLQQLDLSFNPIRNQSNYRLAVISVCKNLKKIDGMKITKFDRDMADQYRKMYHQQLNLIPLGENPSTLDSKYRPSTAVSITYQQQLDNQGFSSSQSQLDQEIHVLQKMIKQTKQQFQIIKDENSVLEDQIQAYQSFIGQREEQQNNPKLYKKLCKEVEELQLLNFLQYASQQQLEQIINKKLKQQVLFAEQSIASN